MAEIELMRVPNFGIEGFVTFKEKRNLSFRPSATDSIEEKAYQKAMSELLEQRDMINYVPEEIKDEGKKEFYRNIEVIGDTSWYKLEKRYIELRNINDPTDFKMFPKDLVLYNPSYDLQNKHQLHWSSSEGYAHDVDKLIALNKGKSEIIEHHTKMFWWFGQSKILEKFPLKCSMLTRLREQKIVKSVRVFEIMESNQFSHSTIMAVLETSSFPFLSVGFGTNIDENSATNHALLEAVHTFRGENWYNLSQPIFPNDFSADFWNRVKKSLVSNQIQQEKEITNQLNPTFYYLVINNNLKGFTTRVYSPELQPLISNQFVPFYFEELRTTENIKLREKFLGTPFI